MFCRQFSNYILLSFLTIAIGMTSAHSQTRPKLYFPVGDPDFSIGSFSPDGTLFASGRLSTIKIWDVKQGRELRTLILKIPALFSLAFSVNNEQIVAAKGGSIDVWDIRTGKLLRTIKHDLGAYTKIVFSPDGKSLAGAGEENKGRVIIWDSASWEIKQTLTGHTDSILSLTFSPDSRILASGSEDKTIKLWDVINGQPLKTLRIHDTDRERIAKLEALRAGKWFDVAPRVIAFSPDGNLLASSGYIHITIWNVATGAILRSSASEITHPKVLSFTPDSKHLVATGEPCLINVWETAGGQKVRSYQKSCESVIALHLTNSKFLALARSPDMAQIWHVDKDVAVPLAGTGLKNEVMDASVSRDGKVLIISRGDGSVLVWDTLGDRGPCVINGNERSYGLALSDDGTMFAIGGNKLIKVREIATGKEIVTLQAGSIIYHIQFSPDYQHIAAYTPEDDAQPIKLWQIATGQRLKPAVLPAWIRLEGKELTPELQAFSTLILNGRELRILFNRGFIELWEESAPAPSLYILGDEKGWGVINSEGLFDGSPALWKRLIWRFNNDTFDYAPVEAYFSDFYYQGLLRDTIAGKRVAAARDLSKIDRRQPKIIISSAAVAVTPLTARLQQIQVEVAEAPAEADKGLPNGEVRDVRLFRNNSLIKVWRGASIEELAQNGCRIAKNPAGSNRKIICFTDAVLTEGENQFTAYAFNRDNVKSEDALMVLQGAASLKRSGVLYVLGVGVNRYAVASENLNYAVPDVQEIGKQLAVQQGRVGQYSRTEIIPLINAQATKANILAALRKLGASGATPLQPEDALIIYFAGHGTTVGERFYLIPHDGFPTRRFTDYTAQENALAQASISDRELETALETIGAGQTLMVIDACESGQSLAADDTRQGPLNAKGLAQLAYDKGMYILTATQRRQDALEVRKLGHGLLTAALLEGLTKADANNDNAITEREWLDYAVAQVPILHEATLSADSAGRSERTKLTKKRSVQSPRVFYRREEAPQPFILARPSQ